MASNDTTNGGGGGGSGGGGWWRSSLTYIMEVIKVDNEFQQSPQYSKAYTNFFFDWGRGEDRVTRLTGSS